MNQINTVHGVLFCFFKIHYHVIPPSALTSSQLSLSFRPPPLHQNPASIYLPSTFTPHPAYLILLDLITGMIFDENYKPWSSSLRSFLQSPVTSSSLAPHISLSTISSDTFSLCFSLNVTDQVQHPYKIRGKIWLYIYIYIYMNVYSFGQQTTRQNNLDRMAGGI
jgi:hypothetical protein